MIKEKQEEENQKYSINFENLNSSLVKTEEKDSDQKKIPTYRRFLRLISIGQYQTKFYYRGEGTYSSSAGGIITIICAMLILVVAIYKTVKVINRD